MKEAVFYYKCRQCGKTYEESRTDQAYALMQPVASSLGELGIHNCEGQDHGLADLVGFRVVTEKK